jgi:hypothetical protein
MRFRGGAGGKSQFGSKGRSLEEGALEGLKLGTDECSEEFESWLQGLGRGPCPFVSLPLARVMRPGSHSSLGLLREGARGVGLTSWQQQAVGLEGRVGQGRVLAVPPSPNQNPNHC